MPPEYVRPGGGLPPVTPFRPMRPWHHHDGPTTLGKEAQNAWLVGFVDSPHPTRHASPCSETVELSFVDTGDEPLPRFGGKAQYGPGPVLGVAELNGRGQTPHLHTGTVVATA